MSSKTLNSIHPSFSFSHSPSSLSSIKLKALLQTFIFSHVYRALSKAKTFIIQLLKHIQMKNKKKQTKLFFGSFRLHYNWAASNSDRHHHVNLQTCSYNSHLEMQDSNDLSKYLQWLEDKGDQHSINEIDKLADLFIANCHEKFRLEKQESYRMFQEMMARSV